MISLRKVCTVSISSLALALAACSGGEEAAPDGSVGYVEPGGAGEDSSSGGSAVSSGALDSYPDDVEIDVSFPTEIAPPYPGAKVVVSRSDASIHQLTVATEDDPADVLKFYEARYPGWDVPVRDLRSQLSTITFTSPRGKTVSLMINRDPIKKVSLVSLSVPK